MNKVYTNAIFNVNLHFYSELLDYLWKGCIMEGEGMVRNPLPTLCKGPKGAEGL